MKRAVTITSLVVTYGDDATDEETIASRLVSRVVVTTRDGERDTVALFSRGLHAGELSCEHGDGDEIAARLVGEMPDALREACARVVASKNEPRSFADVLRIEGAVVDAALEWYEQAAL